MTRPAAGVSRFSVSLPGELLEDLDTMVQRKGYANRSLAIADMVRQSLVEHRHRLGQGTLAGTITLVYDHHKPHLQTTLTSLQHDHHEAIVSTLHVHLDHDHCLEVLVVRGDARIVRRIADQLLAAKGVTHGQLTVASVWPKSPSRKSRPHPQV